MQSTMWNMDLASIYLTQHVQEESAQKIYTINKSVGKLQLLKVSHIKFFIS